MNLDDLKKLPALLESLVKKVPEEIKAGISATVDPLVRRVEALEAGATSDLTSDFDAKVKAAFSDIFGGDFDLSGVETALASFGGTATASTSEGAAPADTSLKADLSSLTSDGAQATGKVDPATAGKQAAAAAAAAGSDPVPAAASAAHSAAVEIGVDPIAAATDAALAANPELDPVSAERAAAIAANAAASGNAPATA